MIYQEMPRKGYEGCKYDEGKGFYVEGNNFDDCMLQLKEWCDAHREKWVYFHDCGVGPKKSMPVARHIFECSIYDEEPACLCLFSRCIQKGIDGRREIDRMTDAEKSELSSKRLRFFAALGASYSRKGEVK